jgi:hypothetical protein
MRRDLRIRFEAAVRRGLARADRARREELAQMQPPHRQTVEERRRVHAHLVDSIFARPRRWS